VLQHFAVCCRVCCSVDDVSNSARNVNATGLCVAECCSVLQSVAECCSVLQYVAECVAAWKMLAIVNKRSAQQVCVLQSVAVCCSVLQCVAVCCSVLQSVAVCYSVLQYVAVCCIVEDVSDGARNVSATGLCVAECCRVL